jgi:hypothetical protein
VAQVTWTYKLRKSDQYQQDQSYMRHPKTIQTKSRSMWSLSTWKADQNQPQDKGTLYIEALGDHPC